MSFFSVLLDLDMQCVSPLLNFFPLFLAANPCRTEHVQLVTQGGQFANKIVFYTARFHVHVPPQD